jgi:hypothetical protein
MHALDGYAWPTSSTSLRTTFQVRAVPSFGLRTLDPGLLAQVQAVVTATVAKTPAVSHHAYNATTPPEHCPGGVPPGLRLPAVS